MICRRRLSELYRIVIVPYGNGFLEWLGLFTIVDMKLASCREVTFFQKSLHTNSSSWTWMAILALIRASSILLLRRYLMNNEIIRGLSLRIRRDSPSPFCYLHTSRGLGRWFGCSSSSIAVNYLIPNMRDDCERANLIYTGIRVRSRSAAVIQWLGYWLPKPVAGVRIPPAASFF
jgi:hypothetical protein